MKRSLLIDHNAVSLSARFAMNYKWPQFINDGKSLRQCNNFREAMNACLASEVRRAESLYNEFMGVDAHDVTANQSL